MVVVVDVTERTQFVAEAVNQWLESCSRTKNIARNTYAIGIVVLDALRKQCPLTDDDILSQGGEIKGARSGLRKTLGEYGVPSNYLKEVTTRQAHQDGQRLLQSLEMGTSLSGLNDDERDAVLLSGIELMLEGVHAWFARQHLKISCPRSKSPSAWIMSIMREAKGKSGGVVEQHLVGAKLAERFPDQDIPNHPGHAADVQTNRPGDFQLGSTVYHVTAAPSPDVIQKCGVNVDRGLHPCLLVTADKLNAAKELAELQGLGEQISISSIEDFVGLNVIELAEGEQQQFIDVLNRIIATYNERLKAVETDMSLRIEIH